MKPIRTDRRRQLSGPQISARAGTCFLPVWLILNLFFPALSPTAPVTRLRAGVYQNHPKVFLDDAGRARGIFVEILDEIADRENWELEYVPGTWSENLRRLAGGEIDLLVDVSFSRERAEEYIFHNNSVLESWLDVYSPQDRMIKSVEDLRHQSIAVLDGSIQEQYLREDVRDSFAVEFTLLTYPDYPSSVEAVKTGAADFLVAGRFFHFSPHRDENLVPSHIILRPENLHFAFRRDIDPSIAGAVDRHLAAMKNNPYSAYYRSLEYWLDLKPRPLIPGYLKTALAVITGLLLAIGLFSLILRRKVAARTRELNSSNEKLKATNRRLDRLNLELRTANENLRETRRLLEETEAIAGLGGWEYDLGTRRMKWTDEVYRIYGVGRDRDPRKTWNDAGFYGTGPARILEEALRRAAEEGEPFDRELELTRPGGVRIWVRITGRPADSEGEVARVTGNIMDITAIKRSEEEKRALQVHLALARKLELVGRLAGGVAHDYNNMLSAILAYSEMAMEKVSPSDPLHDDLRQIFKAGKRSAEIGRQLLAFTGKESDTPRVVDLNEIVGGMLKILGRMIGENIDLDWRPGPGIWPVRIDPSRLDQVLANLCVNARDAIRDVGKIIIETANVSLENNFHPGRDDFVPGDYVMISLTDNGIGMDRETLDRIFEPFFTTKDPGKGTGLGLATVFRIVEENRGLIDVESEPGRGTVFRIYLPRHADGTEAKAKESPDKIVPGRGETILVAEDDPLVRKFIAKIFSSLNYTILSAGSPEEAIRLAGEHGGEIHLLLTDLIMPGMNGRDLAEKIRAARPGIRHLYMSGYTGEAAPRRELLEEEDRFIAKPFTAAELAAKVRAALG